MSENYPPTVALVRMAVERVAADPDEEQRYLELNFALDRAVERNLRYRELLSLFERGALAAEPEAAWAWDLAAGLGANLTGDTAIAIHWLDQAGKDLEVAGRTGTPASSFLYGELARAYYHQGDHAAGAAAANRALQLARSANSRLAEAYGHHYLGLISLRQRDFPYSLRHLTAAVDLFERMHQRHGRARVQDSLATLDMEQGRYEAALERLQGSLSVKEELRDLRGQALTCGNLAQLYTALGDYPEAMHYLDRVRDLTARVGDERNATHAHMQLGRLHLRHANPILAREELRAALELAQERRDHRLEAHVSFSLAEAERQLGNRDAALAAIQHASDYFVTSDDAVMRCQAALRAALLHGFDLNAPEIQGPVTQLRELNVPTPLAESLFEIATFFRGQGRVQEVATLYAEALDAADPPHAHQMAALMRSRADSVEGRAWVDAMLTVKEHKDQLERAYAELRHAESLRDALTQMIVHDLKNPLSAITPWLETIQAGGLDECETKECLQTAINECDYLLRMIDDLNDVGKMQHEGRLELTREPVDLPEMLADVARRLEGRARDSGMRICQAEMPPLPALTGDRHKLRRVLENLVANAVKYGRPAPESGLPPEVWIEARAEPPSAEGERPSVRVQVRDFGSGIPTAEADRVFEPYYQAETGRKRKAGVGLGLAFCRMVVEAHGGTIWTEPNAEGGSVFSFRLPAE
jgi:two-component system sensor histidine kinase/response regulator